jgi:hypothetical protein
LTYDPVRIVTGAQVVLLELQTATCGLARGLAKRSEEDALTAERRRRILSILGRVTGALAITGSAALQIPEVQRTVVEIVPNVVLLLDQIGDTLRAWLPMAGLATVGQADFGIAISMMPDSVFSLPPGAHELTYGPLGRTPIQGTFTDRMAVLERRLYETPFDKPLGGSPGESISEPPWEEPVAGPDIVSGPPWDKPKDGDGIVSTPGGKPVNGSPGDDPTWRSPWDKPVGGSPGDSNF